MFGMHIAKQESVPFQSKPFYCSNPLLKTKSFENGMAQYGSVSSQVWMRDK